MNIIFIPKATINTGDITVDIAPPTEETANITEFETTGVFSIPAGQRFVEIYVAGLVVAGDTEGPATINSQTFNVGDTFKFVSESQIDTKACHRRWYGVRRHRK